MFLKASDIFTVVKSTPNTGDGVRFETVKTEYLDPEKKISCAKHLFANQHVCNFI